ncbi:MAG: hypothetical protein ACRCYP_04530 [Alphaproteobacteria bacterium]
MKYDDTDEMEVGVAFVLSREQKVLSNSLTEQLTGEFNRSGLEVPQVQNHPQISLFQLRTTRQQQANLELEIEAVCKTLSPLNVRMKSSLTDTQENIFWDVEEFLESQDCVNSFHKNLVERLVPYRSSNLLEQIDPKTLNEAQKRDIAKFGIYWGLPGSSFNPHVTLLYGSGGDRTNSTGEWVRIQSLLERIEGLSTQEVFPLRELMLGRLGRDGQITQILKSFQLSEASTSNG